MSDTAFRALRVEINSDGQATRCITERQVSDLPEGDVLVEVHYSSLNYKDALSACGHKGITREFPHTPGIDAAGVIRASSHPDWRQGQEVIVSGYDLGMNTSGGLAGYVRVPADWLVALPDGLALKESMMLGTAGFTTAYCLHVLQHHGVTPGEGEVAVTGATGGVGSLSIALLANLGYAPVAVTGKTDIADELRAWGASDVIARDAFLENTDRPLLSARWSGGIDTVGGEVLNALYKSLRPGAAIACCGMAASPELHTTVYPLILRAVSLLGVASADCPMPLRRHLWAQLAGPWKIPHLDRITTEIPLDEVPAALEAMIAGQRRGRTLVNIQGS